MTIMSIATERMMVGPNKARGMGWRPDLPDFRDFTPEHEIVGGLLSKVKVPAPPGKSAKGAGARASKSPALPGQVDLRPWFSPIEDQESIGACTAHAGVGLIEYFE